MKEKCESAYYLQFLLGGYGARYEKGRIMLEKQISVAVFGCGKMGKTIIEGIEQLPEIKRIVGYDVNEASLRSAKELHPQLEVTTSLEKILSDPDIRLVYIATNNASHVTLASQAMRAGKAVMTEKPSGISFEEIEELIRVQKETGAFLQVGLELRYSRAYVETKKIIQSGEIGRLVNVHFTYSMPPYPDTLTGPDGMENPNWRVRKHLSGSMYLEKLCHYIDIVRWWNEGARVDKYVVTNADRVIPYFEIEDNVHISYHFDNGCTSQLYFIMTAAPGYNNDLMGGDDLFDQDKQGHKLNYVITGTEGAIEIDVFQREVRVYHHPGKEGQRGESLVRTISWTKDEKGSTDFGERRYFHNTYDQNIDIVKRVMNGDGPSISIEDAQESMRLCLEFEEATENRKWEIIYR